MQKGLEAAHLERKMQLLVLSELCFNKVGQQVPYSDISSTLNIEVKDVEKWAIDGKKENDYSMK